MAPFSNHFTEKSEKQNKQTNKFKQTNKQTNISSTSSSHYFNRFPNAIKCWENPQKEKTDSELGPMFSLLPFTGHTADEAQ